jgi:uncharacterized protein (TIGR03032 family)
MVGGSFSQIAGVPQPLRARHTPSFPVLLDALGASLLVTNYQAGKVIAIRAEGEQLYAVATTIRGPMGMAVDKGRMAIGSTTQIYMFHDALGRGPRPDARGRPDACFLPRWSSVTGNIYVHELAWAGPELWIVNARFSCLCTLDRAHSFMPRWRPPFVSALAPEDRCHLNGLCVVNGRPKYVTAHGRSDEPGGWRDNRAEGGILIDVDSGEVVLGGLAMPHSPRRYDGRLWLLDSGRGSIGFVDQASGQYQSVAELPGFTRGLEFTGPYAFVGLSQVRQTSAFSGIPVERLPERICGVWVVDIRTGQTVASLRFEAPIEEVFALQILPEVRFPEVVLEDRRISDSFILPTEELKGMPGRWRKGAGPQPSPGPSPAPFSRPPKP